MEPSSCIQGDETKKRKLDSTTNNEGSPVASDAMDLKHLLDHHSEQMRRMQSQIDGLVAINSTLQARLDDQAERRVEQVDELREKCDVLESRFGSLERCIQVLKKDVSWTYSAPDIPRSHWFEQGHDEEYADNMEDILNSIKEDTKCVKKKVERYCCGCLDNEGQLAITHDDALLPHFQELADAIQLSDGIREFTVDNIELHPSALRILCQAMEGKVTNFNFCSVRFPGQDLVECFDIIAASIRRNYALERLLWIDNHISSDDQADLIIESVMDNRSIKDLRLIHCFNQCGVNGCRALAALMTSGRPFNHLDFSDNGLSGIDDVAAALATNPQLEELLMSGKELTDRDAELIAHALKQNTNLQRLRLRGNNITSAGIEKIRTTIYDPSSLNAMESCNHTCWVDCVKGNAIGNYVGALGVNEDDMTPRQRRNRKLYLLLSTRNLDGSNARHLNAELGEEKYTIKLVPKVLHCIKRYSSDKTADSTVPLSITFELIKSWMMPELFENY
ncbi:hypothetical protein THAOC_17783 [Thalassiosira oceanica]|uniref:Uncharacterized protein n=1 Tax=Thalassiosira oceanica TaxID=159749 RepID=K0S9X2_THAOC|nr:hypothetical protein THAOC_17783 [Thalassiosira oceanica]|eukprot:EJK61684.1 hypothetical protein THAOC_17783 [Thalassiosira oceanica]